MLTLKVVFLLYLTKCVATNATTAAQRARAQKQAVAACQNLTSSVSDGETTTTTLSFLNALCWGTLNMANWMTSWNASTTVCTATQSVLTPCQCRLDEPWATCFMRLTYEGNRSASYVCTDLTKPDNCTMPVPGNVVAGPVEIFYGAFSASRFNPDPYRKSSLFNYLTKWYTSLTGPTALRAINAQLSDAKTSALSANDLLVALIKDYATDKSLGQALVSILTNRPLLSKNMASAKPTISNAQELLGQLLQQALEVTMSDWACGDFQTMASEGMLLNGTAETTETLDTNLMQLGNK